MHERTVRFGDDDHLVGITATAPSRKPDVGVIVLNAGLVYHVGPFRLHVELTRQLNDAGYPSLRFDLSTLGDSGASDTARASSAQVQQDVSDAMNVLARQSGCSRFVLIGLCSGASNAHRVASEDPRVVGAVFLDGHAFRTLGFYVRHYLPRLADPVRVLRFLLRPRRRMAAGGEADFQAPRPPRARVTAELGNMLARGLKLNFIFSGGASSYFNDVRQLGECYGRSIARHPGLSAHFFAEADHTYILVEDRARLIAHIRTWLQQHVPVSNDQI